MDAYVSATRKLSASVKRRRLARFQGKDRIQAWGAWFSAPKVYIIFLIRSKITRHILL
jgi:hypothetical protein